MLCFALYECDYGDDTDDDTDDDDDDAKKYWISFNK